MQLLFTRSFVRDQAKLPPPMQQRMDKQLALLLENPRHPSLHLKPMQGREGVWEIRISGGYRLTLQITEEAYILRRVGSHDVLRQP
jgi:mRNA-degrading endonuclease RelE of RelBE toxin-antitoxin system